MVSESTQGQNMRPNRLSHILKSSMNTVLFVNATIGFFLKTFFQLSIPRRSCNPCGYTMKMSSRYHRLLIYDEK